MAHPIAEYLEASGDTLEAFAGRAGMEIVRLKSILSGAETPDLLAARRILAAAGGGVTIEAIYEASDIAVFDAARACAPDALDPERLASALSEALGLLDPRLADVSGGAIARAAADAVANTYDALAGVTSRRGGDRLAQALRGVLEEILRDFGAPPPVAALEAAARLAAQKYLA